MSDVKRESREGETVTSLCTRAHAIRWATIRGMASPSPYPVDDAPLPPFTSVVFQFSHCVADMFLPLEFSIASPASLKRTQSVANQDIYMFALPLEQNEPTNPLVLMARVRNFKLVNDISIQPHRGSDVVLSFTITHGSSTIFYDISPFSGVLAHADYQERLVVYAKQRMEQLQARAEHENMPCIKRNCILL